MMMHNVQLNNVSTGCFKKVAAPASKTFWNTFTLVKSFCVKFYTVVGNSYPHIFANLCTFILIFHQMASIFHEYPSFSPCQVLSIECRRFVSIDLARKPSFPVTLTKGGS